MNDAIKILEDALDKIEELGYEVECIANITVYSEQSVPYPANAFSGSTTIFRNHESLEASIHDAVETGLQIDAQKKEVMKIIDYHFGITLKQTTLESRLKEDLHLDDHHLEEMTRVMKNEFKVVSGYKDCIIVDDVVNIVLGLR